MITDSIAKDGTGWDEAGEFGDLQLYDATLMVDTKKFKAGDKVDCITFLFSKSICQIWQPKGKVDDKYGFHETEMIEEFPIKLSVLI